MWGEELYLWRVVKVFVYLCHPEDNFVLKGIFFPHRLLNVSSPIETN